MLLTVEGCPRRPVGNPKDCPKLEIVYQMERPDPSERISWVHYGTEGTPVHFRTRSADRQNVYHIDDTGQATYLTSIRYEERDKYLPDLAGGDHFAVAFAASPPGQPGTCALDERVEVRDLQNDVVSTFGGGYYYTAVVSAGATAFAYDVCPSDVEDPTSIYVFDADELIVHQHTTSGFRLGLTKYFREGGGYLTHELLSHSPWTDNRYACYRADHTLAWDAIVSCAESGQNLEASTADGMLLVSCARHQLRVLDKGVLLQTLEFESPFQQAVLQPDGKGAVVFFDDLLIHYRLPDVTETFREELPPSLTNVTTSTDPELLILACRSEELADRPQTFQSALGLFEPDVDAVAPPFDLSTEGLLHCQLSEDGRFVTMYSDSLLILGAVERCLKE